MAVGYWDPVKPKSSDSQYRGLKLSNGITVLLVHNPTKVGEERDYSAAALSLARGHLNDPTDFPGMAHFCEHMLFLGNEKYPVEGEYRKYLQEHGGGSNAFTSPEMTLYKFHITDEYFENGLDRFLNFFRSPLFTESATGREILAVDSEYKKCTLSDSRRCYNLLKHLCNPDHVFHRFGSGNKKSLEELPAQNNQNIREALLSFYDVNYCSEIMNLVVVSNRSLDELEQMVVGKEGFGDIPSKGLQKKVTYPGTHLGPNQLGRVAEYVAVQDQLTLTVVVPIPDTALQSDCDYSKTSLIIDLLGHEGDGTLCHCLREEGLITDLYSGDNIKETFGHINVEFFLTEKGQSQYRYIVSSLCQYANLIIEHLDSTCVSFHAEKLYSKQLRFDFLPNKNANSLATSLARSMIHTNDPKNCISYSVVNYPKIFDEEEKKIVKQCLEQFTSDNILILLTNKNLAADGNPVATEPWWGVQYRVRELSELEKKEIATPTSLNLKLPGKNEWLPKHTDIVQNSGTGDSVSSLKPFKITSSKSLINWWAANEKFNTPKCKIVTCLRSGVFGSSAVGSVVASWIIPDLCALVLASKYYAAEDSGVSRFSIYTDRDYCGVVITVSGFSDCATRMSTSLVDDLLNCNFTEKQFNVIRENRLREIANSKLQNTTTLSSEAMRELLNVSIFSTQEMDESMASLTYNEFITLLKQSRDSISAETFSYGNVSRPDAESLGQQISSLITSCNDNNDCIPRPDRKVVKIPEDTLSEYLYVMHEPNPTNKESAVAVRYQFDTFSYSLAAQMMVLRALISPRFFTTLRTVEQLGYSVSTSYLTLNEVLNLQFNVRSSTSPDEVHQRIDVFLKNFHEELLNMPEKDVNDCIASTKSSYAAPSPNMETEFGVLAHEIMREVYRWNREEEMLKQFSLVTRSGLISLFETFIRPVSWSTASRRSVLSVYSLTDYHFTSTTEKFSGNNLIRTIDNDSETEVNVKVKKINQGHIRLWREGMEHYNFNATASSL